MDLSFNIGTSCFNLRACAVIVHGETLLVMRDQKLSYAYLPGGRIKLNETAQQALIRELQEEIGIQAQIERPLWVTQAFFTESASQQKFHEIGFYFLVSCKENETLPTINNFIRWENGIEHRFEWVSFDELSDIDVQPEFIKNRIRSLPEQLELLLDFNQGSPDFG